MKFPAEILVATNNRGKFSEIAELLQSINIRAVSAVDLALEPEETGNSFAQNASLKARYYAKAYIKNARGEHLSTSFRKPSDVGNLGKSLSLQNGSQIKVGAASSATGIMALADDSGLCIEALNGEPGIYSARFAKNNLGKTDFNFAFDKIFSELKKINAEKNARAFFVCSLCLFDPETNFEISFEGRVYGELTFPPRGNDGFGYDPIFIKDGMEKTFGEIGVVEKDKISHRAIAFKKLSEWLEKEFSKN